MARALAFFSSRFAPSRAYLKAGFAGRALGERPYRSSHKSQGNRLLWDFGNRPVGAQSSAPAEHKRGIHSSREGNHAGLATMLARTLV